jgi:hypothetical protein
VYCRFIASEEKVEGKLLQVSVLKGLETLFIEIQLFTGKLKQNMHAFITKLPFLNILFNQ